MKKLYALLFTLALFVLMPLTIEASSLNEDAIDLPRNDSIHSLIPEKSDLTKIVDDTDSRFYKVSLGMNAEESLTLVPSRNKTFDVEIMDNSGNLIVQRYGVGNDGNRQIKFATNYIGDYYIYIKPSNDGGSDYPYSLRVIAGEPVYLALNPDHRVNLNTTSITSSKTTSSTQYFDLTNISSIPDDAILTNILVGGKETNRYLTDLYTLKRSILPDSTNNWIDAEYPLYQPSQLDHVPKYAQVKVKQRYAFRISGAFSSSGTYTLNQPYIILSYKREMK